MRKALATATLAALTLTMSPAVAMPDGPAGHGHREWNGCRVEDGSGQARCIWDARHMGNGHGRSLKIIRGGTEDGRYIFIPHRRAHHLLHCH